MSLIYIVGGSTVHTRELSGGGNGTSQEQQKTHAFGLVFKDGGSTVEASKATPYPVEQVFTALEPADATLSAINIASLSGDSLTANSATTALTLSAQNLNTIDITVAVAGTFPLTSVNSVSFLLQRKTKASAPWQAVGSPITIDTSNATFSNINGWIVQFPFHQIRVVYFAKDGAGTTPNATVSIRASKM